VLNASRHHRKNRFFCFADGFAFPPKCSTPRGITGKIATLTNSTDTTPGGAQRLAASPEKSRFQPSRVRRKSPVLNASRHHRKNRATPRLPSTTAGEVLNASRHHRKNRARSRRARIPIPKGAQRLAASPEKSRSKSGWEYNPDGCAQRLAASPEKSRIGEFVQSPHAVSCSTPRGITGKIAICLRVAPVKCSTCSTPRGITGKIACLCGQEASSGPMGAQRLAASPEKSPLDMDYFVAQF